MPADPSVIAAIAAAVQQTPDNIALRMHLGALLLENGQPAEALEQFSHVLAQSPSHREALARAAESAEACGDKIRAHGYRQLLDALSWDAARKLIGEGEPGMPPPPPAWSTDVSPPPLPPVPAGGDRERVPVHRDGEEDRPTWETERPVVTLAEVAGMEEVKRRLNLAFLAPMRNPDMMKLYGRSTKGGLLLYGPPGCGKTFIARAVAGELGARFLAVGLSDVLDMWLGASEKNLHEIFETARRSKPCVLFLDEIDAIGRKRSLMRHSAGRDVVNQLLAEMDSVEGNNEGVFVLAATNHPWDVDVALRRPGRLDRTLLVLPPDRQAREQILRLNLRDRPVEKADLAAIAAKTEDYSGADIAHVCDSAAELAMEASLSSGHVRPIGQADLLRAVKEVRPSVRPWFETARNYAQFANEGGVYDELLEYLRARRMA